MVEFHSMTQAAFKRLRLSLGLTQAQLAAELGVSENSVSRWELGTRKINEPVARLLTMLCQRQPSHIRRTP